MSEVDNHKGQRRGRKKGVYYILCECGVRLESPSNATQAKTRWQNHNKENSIRDNKSLPPQLLGIIQKQRVNHEYWLYHVGQVPDLKLTNHWANEWMELAQTKCVVIRKQSNGLKVMDVFFDRRQALVYMDFQFMKWKSQGQNVITEKNAETLEGIEAPVQTMEAYATDLLQQITNTNTPTNVKALVDEVENLQNALRLIVQAKNEMIERMFT